MHLSSKKLEKDKDNTMSAEVAEKVSINISKKRDIVAKEEAPHTSYRHALHAGYEDICKLRFDFPLVLTESDSEFAVSLTDIFNGVIKSTAPQGNEGENNRKYLFTLEREIRALVSNGKEGTLLQLWDMAWELLRKSTVESSRRELDSCIKMARKSLKYDGVILNFNSDIAFRLLSHAWKMSNKTRTHTTTRKIEQLLLRLHDILKVEYLKSDTALCPDNLKSTVGTGYEEEFDFEVMSTMLGNAAPFAVLSNDRKSRINSAIEVLSNQKFCNLSSCDEESDTYVYLYESCSEAVNAFKQRLPQLLELIKAISIAELELDNLYKEPKHDSFFGNYSDTNLTGDDLALFPTYLILLDDNESEVNKSELLEILNSQLPVKIVFLSNNLFNSITGDTDKYTPDIDSYKLAKMAVGLDSAHVLQTCASNLYQLREIVNQGLNSSNPAFFSIYATSEQHESTMHQYLLTASAMDSRAFPAFSFNPDGGKDWADRFSLCNNPQQEYDWPRHTLHYEDHDLQSHSEDILFTIADYAASDTRYKQHFSSILQEEWHENMLPAGEYLNLSIEDQETKTPYVLMIDDKNRLIRMTVDEEIINIALNCRNMWHTLQEQGGINNSNAAKLLEIERCKWEEEKEKEIAELKSQQQTVVASETTTAVEEVTSTEEKEPVETVPPVPEGEPYIETARCTTCNECTQINDQMFTYNENMQAYVKDADAGTFKQMVEAAESCQISIIHPGKPRNPDEPDLEELIKRAEVFN